MTTEKNVIKNKTKEKQCFGSWLRFACLMSGDNRIENGKNTTLGVLIEETNIDPFQETQNIRMP